MLLLCIVGSQKVYQYQFYENLGFLLFRDMMMHH